VIQSYRELKVWQAAMDLAESVYSVLASFPKSEAYGISQQIQRAVVSVPSNIAERHARDSTKDFLRFLSIAMGSLAELETQLLLSFRLQYLDNEQLSYLLRNADELGRMLRGLQQALRAKLAPNP
jgi:four helix bundle protein